MRRGSGGAGRGILMRAERARAGAVRRHLSAYAIAAVLAGVAWPAGAESLVAQEAAADDSSSVAGGAAAATVRLPAVRANVRRSLLDPGLARSVERLDVQSGTLLLLDLADWLDSRTGTGVRSRGAGGRQVLSVRGGRPEGVLVLLDGLPINDPLTGEADLASVPISSLSSATLVRGAGSARYGSGALGGALLLESASADHAVPVARLGVGSYGAYEISASGGRQGDVGLRVGAGVRGADNDYAYENRLAHGSPERVRRNADSESRWLNLSAETSALRATVRHDHLERGVPGRLGTTAFDGDRWRESRWSAAVSAGSDRASGRIGLRRLSMRYAPADAGGGASTSGQRALDVRLGGEAGVPRLGGLVVAGRASLERLRGDGIEDADRFAAGASGRRTFHLAAGSVGFEPVLAFDAGADGSAFSPELGAWVRPDASTRIYGRVGRSYRLPTFADLHFEAAPGVRPNADLEAERVVLDTELGLELSRPLGDVDGALKLAVWRRDTGDPIVWLASSVAVWSPRNLDRLLARGLEIEASVRGPAPRPAGLSWALEAGLTLQESRVGFGSNRNPLPYQPDVAASARAEVRRGSFAARLDATYTGSRTTSLAATRRLDGFLTVDVEVRRRFTPGSLDIVASLDAENVFDRRYELVELFPEPGRTLRLTVEIHPMEEPEEP